MSNPFCKQKPCPKCKLSTFRLMDKCKKKAIEKILFEYWYNKIITNPHIISDYVSDKKDIIEYIKTRKRLYK